MYTVGPGPICKCMGQCTLEGSVQDGFQCTLRQHLHTGPGPTVYTALLAEIIYRAIVQDYHAVNGKTATFLKNLLCIAK